MIARFLAMPQGGIDPAARLLLRRGTIADYDALACHHYRAGRPATIAGIWAAQNPETHEPVAVLVLSRPALEGRWREAAWPGRYTRGSKRERAARLNAEVRTISRLIVDPRYRGLGVGRRLLRAYLDNPLTPATEAIAAMGACCPIFKAAGMTEYRLAPDKRDARLLDALAHLSLTPAALPNPAANNRLSTAAREFLTRELRLWADASRTTRALLAADPSALARRAALALLQPRLAYACSCHRDPSSGPGALPPLPQPSSLADSLPSPLTIFLSAAERRTILRSLRKLHPCTPEALKRALGLFPGPPSPAAPAPERPPQGGPHAAPTPPHAPHHH